MIKITQDELDVVPQEDIVVFAELDTPKHTYLRSYPLINEFDGVDCEFGFPEGGGWGTVIPFSTGKYIGVVITILEGWVEYQITDDRNKKHYLYIRSSESKVIFESLLSYKNNYGIIPTLK